MLSRFKSVVAIANTHGDPALRRCNNGGGPCRGLWRGAGPLIRGNAPVALRSATLRQAIGDGRK